MKRICNFILLLCLVQLAVAQNRITEIKENLLGDHPDKILVVSHRADWRNAPENSLQGIQNCIDMGVDMVEIDLKRTKDGHLVVMHDKTINRTMSGKGLVEDYTLAELKAMRLKNGVACKTRHQIPTLEEVMLLCKGKIMVNIDKGYDYFQEAYIVLEKTWSLLAHGNNIDDYRRIFNLLPTANRDALTQQAYAFAKERFSVRTMQERYEAWYKAERSIC